MPTYCYKCPSCNKITERVRLIAQRNDTVRCTCDAGLACTRDIPSEHKGFIDTPGNWPMESGAMGIDVEDIPRAKAICAAKGVNVEYNDKTGDAIWSSPRKKREHCEALGYYDRNAGYSDPLRQGA